MGFCLPGLRSEVIADPATRGPGIVPGSFLERCSDHVRDCGAAATNNIRVGARVFDVGQAVADPTVGAVIAGGDKHIHPRVEGILEGAVIVPLANFDLRRS